MRQKSRKGKKGGKLDLGIWGFDQKKQKLIHKKPGTSLGLGGLDRGSDVCNGREGYCET